MTDEQPKDQVPDPSDGADSGVAPEDDLDALLAEASALAGELAEELGEAERAVSSDEADQMADAPVDSSDHLDAQLAELEELARTAGSEIGVASEELRAGGDSCTGTEPNESAPEVDSAPSRDSASRVDPAPPEEKETENGVPTFMVEFTRPEEPPAEDPPAGDSPTAEPAIARVQPAWFRSGVISSKAVGNLRRLDDIPGLDDAPTEQAGGTPEEQQVELDESQAAGKTYAVRNSIRRMAAHLSPAALVVCRRGVDLLEAIDKPLGRIGATHRRIIGYVALATFTTSVIALLISLF